MSAQDITKYKDFLLQQMFHKNIQENERHIHNLNQYIASHQEVIKNLQQFGNELSVDCLVPMGKLAFFKGKLTHTNELLALLGDEYFGKYSQKQTIELIQRKIKRAVDALKDFEKQNESLKKQLSLAAESGAMESQGEENFDQGAPIEEYWDEESLEKWKAEHKVRMQGHSKTPQTQNVLSDDEINKRLDELELEELILEGKEMNNDNQIIEKKIDKLDDDEIKNIIKTDNRQPETQGEILQKNESILSNKENKATIIVDKEKKNYCDDSYDTDHGIKIHFKHSSKAPVFENNPNKIDSPKDIFNVFSMPVSILKKSNSNNTSINKSVSLPDNHQLPDTNESRSIYSEIVHDIRETSQKSENKNATRPMSKFKRERKNV
ncbi:RNA polymerase II subunit 5-mediating protein homolog [Trichogramma pretiosum]|uniref:RNA polymerase II subunit 5-mediating protein homolog n=1 Tax=Trichogramma pretiosum TaxID=7493 RepID=UPI0006C97600|nr:RNA polymerase II subunit 5-mediating protein homolog [Trichogramma pretiosum]